MRACLVLLRCYALSKIFEGLAMLAEAASCGDRLLCACYELVALERAAALRWLGFCRFERLRSKYKAIDCAKAASTGVAS